MKAFFNAISRFFRAIFGGGSTSPSKEDDIIKPDPDATPPPMSDGPILELALDRYSSGTHDTLGKLSVNGEFQCYTLESSESSGFRLSAGSYELILRTKKIGINSTYFLKYREWHKGMLWLKSDAPNFEYVYIHVGHTSDDTVSGLVVGTATKGDNASESRAVTDSMQAYQNVYTSLANHLENGGRAKITIT